MKISAYVAVILVVLSTLFAACTTLTDDSSLTPSNDRDLVNEVQNRLQQDSITRNDTFSVDTRDGIVTVRGVVTDTVRLRALGIVTSTPGVVKVIDDIKTR